VTIGTVLMVLLGWPAMLAVVLLVVAASVALGLVFGTADRIIAAFGWPARVPGGMAE
jgi:hypothetical protein